MSDVTRRQGSDHAGRAIANVTDEGRLHYATGHHRKPCLKLALRRTVAALPLRRRGYYQRHLEDRRISSYFIPIPQPRKKGNKQLQFDTEWTKDRIEKNKVVNRIRQRVGLWREGGYLGVTPTTSKLFEYWTKPERERKLFFCQIEALETAIYIAEGAKKYGDCISILDAISVRLFADLPRVFRGMMMGPPHALVKTARGFNSGLRALRAGKHFIYTRWIGNSYQ
jgi:hypothetical protein